MRSRDVGLLDEVFGPVDFPSFQPLRNSRLAGGLSALRARVDHSPVTPASEAALDYPAQLRAERTLYYGAKLVGQVAQNLLLAALFISAGTSSHAAIGLSSLMVAMLVPTALFGFPGGAIVDRVGPARGFVLGSALRLAAVLCGLLVLRGSNTAWAIAFLYSTVSQVGGPAEMALVRTLRGRAAGPAHSMIVALQYGGQAVGMLVLAPALYLAAGQQAIMVAALAGFALLLVMSVLLTLRLRWTAAADAHPAVSPFSLTETLRFFRREALARDAITVLAVKSMVVQGVIVTLPMYLKHDMGLGTKALAFLLLPGIAGAITGLVWAGGPRLTADRCRNTMRLSLIAMIVSLFALSALDLSITIFAEYSHVPPIAELAVSMNTTFAVALPVAFLLGIALSGSLVTARVVLTNTAPLDQQARVFAVQSMLTDALVVLPLLLLGVGAQFAGARPTLAAIGLVGVGALLLLDRPAKVPARRVLVAAPVDA